MLRIAVLISGGGTNLQSLIDASKQQRLDGDIVLVISNRQSAYGLQRAREAGIQAEWIKDPTCVLKRLQEEKIDLVVLAGYLAIVPKEMIEAYQHRIINIHPSLIPSFCGPGFYGLHVHEHALARGVKVSGATVHFVSEEVDGGPIILQEATYIGDLESATEIQQRVLEIEHRLLPQAVSLFCQNRLKVENERVKII